MKIAMSSGHGKYIRGASGYPVPPQLDEVDEARRVVDRTAEILNSMDGVSCVTFHDNTSHDQNTNLHTITNWHNAQTRDYDVSVHFNAYDGNAHGTEVLYVTQQSLASKLSAAICAAGGFTNRGAKYRSDLYVLNNTEMPAVLLETCFCDNTGDSNKYNAAFEDICTAIAEELSGQQAPDEKPPEQPPEPEEPPLPSEKNHLDINTTHTGNMIISLNEQELVVGEPQAKPNIVRMTLSTEGDVTITINGQDWHNYGGTPSDPPSSGAPPPSEHRTLAKGDTGNDVAEVQSILGIPPDGDFGAQTDGAVCGFQAAMGLAVDGIVGDKTWAELDALDSKMLAGSAGISQAMQENITEIARNSALAAYSWQDRGYPPKGYIPGMALAFALAAGAWASGDSSALLMARANTHDDDTDALSWYCGVFDDLGMYNSQDGIDTLRHLFVLLIGLGMRESSGDHWCGRDMSAENTSPDTAEAGLFQSSWNLSTATSEIQKLFNAYWSDPNGFQDTFSQGLNPDADDLRNYGNGVQGTMYQWLAKYCPAFACFMTAVGLRMRRQHWGPINRFEVEVLPEADEMLLQVQNLCLPDA